MSECPCSYEIRDGLVFIRGPRVLVVLPVSVWVSGIRRGKSYRRHGGLKPGGARIPPRGDIVDCRGK